MKLVSALLSGLLMTAAALSQAQGDPAAGERLYVTCAACHGADGGGNQALNAPSLTHLDSVYIVAQIQKFKTGQRGGAGASPAAMQMAGMAATLSDDQAALDVATYIASLTGSASAVSVEGDVAAGGDYYNQLCGACHGPAAEGNVALNSPSLAGADDWYLLAQLEAFRSGSRGTAADDRTGKQMRAMAGILPDDKTVADVVAFIRSQEQ